MINGSDPINSKTRAALLALFRNMNSRANGHIPAYETEAAMIEMIRDITNDQLEASLYACMALSQEMAKSGAKQFEDMKKAEDFLQKHIETKFPKVKITRDLLNSAIAIFMGSYYALDNPKLMEDILGPEAAKRIAEAHNGKQEFVH